MISVSSHHYVGITLLIGLLKDRRFTLPDTSFHDGLDAARQSLEETMNHPEFQKVLAEIQSLPPTERLKAIFTELTPPALAARGIPVSEGFTIATDASLHPSAPKNSSVDQAAIGQDAEVESLLQASVKGCVPFIPWQVCLTLPVRADDHNPLPEEA
jgi:hypothetical protein